MEVAAQNRRIALDQLREDRSARSSELAKLHSDLEYLEQAAWPKSTSRAQVLREDAEIAACSTRSSPPKKKPAARSSCASSRWACQHDGSRRSTRKPRSATSSSKPSAGPDGIHREYSKHHQGIDQITHTQVDEASPRINENFGVVFSRLFMGPRPSCALPMRRIRTEAGPGIVARLREKSSRTYCCSLAERKRSPPRASCRAFRVQPSPFCVARRSRCRTRRNQRGPACRPVVLAE